MTRAIPFTQASLKRALNAAREAGVSVKEIRPDGTLVLGEPYNSQAPQKPVETEPEVVL